METAVATAIAFAGLVVVLLALRSDAEQDAPAPALPDWEVLPTRSDLARTEWPLRVPGYDPAAVEQAFDLLADAFADLLAESDPATVARARRRAAARLGREDELDALHPGGAEDAPAVDPVLLPPAGAPAPDPTDEALRAEAGLAALQPEPAFQPEPALQPEPERR